MKVLKIIFILSLFLLSFVRMNAQSKIEIAVNGKTMIATLADTESAYALKELLVNGAVKIAMRDYGGFEKVGSLPQSLPTDDYRLTTEPGDIMLYQGNQLVIFYGSNTWAYSPLGKIDNADAASIKNFLGNGDIELTISLSYSTEATFVSSECKADKIYDLSGQLVTARPLSPGVYIINGKKVRY